MDLGGVIAPLLGVPAPLQVTLVVAGAERAPLRVESVDLLLRLDPRALRGVALIGAERGVARVLGAGEPRGRGVEPALEQQHAVRDEPLDLLERALEPRLLDPTRVAGEVRKAVTAKLDLVDQAGTHSAIAGVVAAWRDGAAAASAEQLGAVMDTLDVRFALVLAGTDTIQVWAKGPGDRVARKLDDGVDDDVMGIAAMISDRVAAWDGRAPDPDLPLLYETDRERTGRRADPVRWWVYASIVGAVLVGSGILYLQDTADDHQTITISF